MVTIVIREEQRWQRREQKFAGVLSCTARSEEKVI